MDRENSEEESTRYKVVVNHEEQYSIWPEDRTTPLGWKDVGPKGAKADCLAYIDRVWTDMRPLSLRKKMEEEASRTASAEPAAELKTPPAAEQDTLVKRLSQGRHSVEAGLRSQKTVRSLKECIDRGYVHIRFTETRGGTELGVRIDSEASDLTDCDFKEGRGTAHLEGRLTLDFVRVTCSANIDLATLKGVGQLVPIDSPNEDGRSPTG